MSTEQSKDSKKVIGVFYPPKEEVDEEISTLMRTIMERTDDLDFTAASVRNLITLAHLNFLKGTIDKIISQISNEVEGVNIIEEKSLEVIIDGLSEFVATEWNQYAKGSLHSVIDHFGHATEDEREH